MPQPVIDNPHLIEYLGIKALRSSHPEVRKLKRQQVGHSAHGNKVWRSSFVLMDYLTTYPPQQYSRVLDIGCGWGLTGLFVAKHYDAKVTGVDIDKRVEPFLALQARVNECQMAFAARSFESLSFSELSDYQLMMGTDICFWDEMTDPLFNFINSALKAGVKNIYIADPGRPPFWELADRCSQRLNSEIITRRIYQPFKSEKYILVIKQK